MFLNPGKMLKNSKPEWAHYISSDTRQLEGGVDSQTRREIVFHNIYIYIYIYIYTYIYIYIYISKLLLIYIKIITLFHDKATQYCQHLKCYTTF